MRVCARDFGMPVLACLFEVLQAVFVRLITCWGFVHLIVNLCILPCVRVFGFIMCLFKREKLVFVYQDYLYTFVCMYLGIYTKPILLQNVRAIFLTSLSLSHRVIVALPTRTSPGLPRRRATGK